MTTASRPCRPWAGTRGAPTTFAVRHPASLLRRNVSPPAIGLLDRCYAHEIKSVADAIVAQGLDKLGYQYVNMDDCWSATTRDGAGQLQVNLNPRHN